MLEEPDYEFDGYLCTSEGERFLCDIRLWLPKETDADAAIEVVVIGEIGSSSALQGFVTLISEEAVDAAGLRFEAKGAYIRSSRSIAQKRRAGGTRLKFLHISSWTIEKGPVNIESSPEQTFDSVVIKLSALDYGAPKSFDTFTPQGNRTIEELDPPKLLSIRNASGDVKCEWHLQRYWEWSKTSRSKIIATAYTALSLCDASKRYTAATREELLRQVNDICLLLTLAARHRVFPHIITTSAHIHTTQKWLNPLQRQRATTEEEALGPLIAQTHIEDYFIHMSKWWSSLDLVKKDAIRLAIFAINPSTNSTLESNYIAKFSAFEGLVKRWGPKETSKLNLKAKTEAMLQLHSPRISGLWPLFDNTGGKSLYWIRNELAHGREVMRLAPGALSLANDHLHLWLEYTLLAIAGYSHQTHWGDWLSNEIPSQREQLKQISLMLERQATSPIDR